MVFNPAETARDEQLSVHFYHRQQWIGFEGAPSTQYLSIQNHFHKQKLNLGLSFSNDNAGGFKQQDVILYGAYRIPTHYFDIYLGINAGLLVSSSDFSKYILENYGDNNFEEANTSYSPNVGSGVLLQGDAYFLSLSFPQIIDNTPKNKKANFLDVNTRNLYFRGGYLFELAKDKHEFIPNVALRLLENGQNEIDVNLKYRYVKQLEGMLSFHSLNSMGMAINYLWHDHFSFGYMLDFPLNSLASHQGGTHQLMLAYKIETEKNIRVVNPRDF